MKLYRYLPAIIRLRDSLASGFPPDSGVPEVDLPAGGASSTLAGNVAAYNFRRAPAPTVIDYSVYFVRWEVSTDGGAWEPLEDYDWQPRRDEQRLEASFPLLDNGKETFHHFRVRVYGDEHYSELLWERDSSADQTAWTVRLQPIFERIFYMFERDASTQQMLIRDLPVLTDADHVDPLYLVYLAYLVGGGDRFPGNLSEFRQREFVKAIVDLFKIKGTQLALKKLARLRNLGTINLRELYKSTYNETGEYSAANDDAHPFKSARVQLMACETQCESFVEFDASGVDKPTTNLSVGEQIQLLERDLDDFRPVHVLVCRLLQTTDLASEFPATSESIKGSVLRSLFVDSFPDILDELEITPTCVSQCQTLCQLCEELVMDPCPFDAGIWNYKLYTGGVEPVPPALAAFYAARGGFVTGAAPADYYLIDFDDSDFLEGKSRFTTANGFAEHSEFVMRKNVILNWVTGIVVQLEFVYDDFGELYWNEVLLTPAIGTAGAKKAEEFPFDPFYNQFVGRLIIDVPESALRVGRNYLAVRCADHAAAPTLADVEVRVSFRQSADADQDKAGPTTVVF